VVILASLIFTVYFWLPVAMGCEPCPPSTDGIACKDAAYDSHASIWLVNAHCPLNQYSPMATLLQVNLQI